jgi:hypothetical protein
MKPTIEILIGAPLRGSEASFLRTICSDLQPHGPSLILANFEVGSGPSSCQIDFVVVAANRTELLELKCFSGPIFGDQNGTWRTEDRSGNVHILQGHNPWEQARDAKLALNDAMHEYGKRHPDVPVPIKGKFFEFDASVCVFPQIHLGSKVTRGNFKAWVSSYPEVLQRLAGKPLPSSWHFAQWKNFAIDHLHLTPVSLEEAVDPKVNLAKHSIKGYLRRLERGLKQGLAPLLPSAEGESCGQTLVTRLLGPQNYFLISRSGLGKTFHLQHLACQAGVQGEVPVLIETRYYMGDFNRTLHKAISPFTESDPGTFFDSVRLCGLRPLIIVDGFNECRERLLPDLLKDLLAVQLRLTARLVCASQHEVAFPGGLAFDRIDLAPLRLEHQRAIYCFHAGLDSTNPAVDHLCDSFATAYDLTVAGHCHDVSKERMTRAELYDRYCHRLLPGDYRAVTAFLFRRVASAMNAELCSTLSRAEFEQLVDRCLEETQTPLRLLDDLRSCRLLQRNEDSVYFEHDLLRDYFAADELRRQNLPLDDLISELLRPKNQSLVEFVLPRITSSDDLRRILEQIRNPEQLDAVLEGRAGELAEKILRDDCARLFEAAVADLPFLSIGLKTLANPDNRATISYPEVKNHRTWSDYEAMLCTVIAKHLDDPYLCSRFLELLGLTAWALRRATDIAARDLRLKRDVAWGEVVRVYGVLDGGTFALPMQRILSAVRHNYRFSSRIKPPQIFYEGLRNCVKRESCPDFALLCLLDLVQYRPVEEINFRIELLRKAAASGVFIVQVHAIQMIEFCASHVIEHCPEKKAEIIGLLESLLPGDGRLDMAGVMEALCAYDAVESPVTVEDALREVDLILHAKESGLAEQDPLVAELGYSPDQVITEQAYGWLSRIFESVSQGVYSEAYHSLADSQKSRLLCLAAQTGESRCFTTWILQEMLWLDTKSEAAPIYERFASSVETKGCSQQEAVQVFVLGILGCARVSDEPCPYKAGDTVEHRGWDLVGQMLFWLFKFGPERVIEKIENLWDRVSLETPLAAADVLYRLRSAASMMYASQDAQNAHEDLMKIAPSVTLQILEHALLNRGRLTSLFPLWPGGRDTEIVLFVIETLGRFGNQSSVELLKEVVDDPELGNAALAAIKRIRENTGGRPQAEPQSELK